MNNDIEITLDMFKWSIGNTFQLWSYLHITIIACVGAAWFIRKTAKNISTFWLINGGYSIVAISNLMAMQNNQQMAYQAFNIIQTFLNNASSNYNLLAGTMKDMNVFPVWQIVFFHIILDLIVIGVIYWIGNNKENFD